MPHITQRFTYALELGKDAASDELVHVDHVVPPIGNQVRACLWDSCGEHCALFDILPHEEDKIRSSNGIPDWIPTPDIFEEHPETMPRVFKSWAPKYTIVNTTLDGTAVAVKDSKQNGLIRFWISSEESSDDEGPTACITMKHSNQQKKTEFQLTINVSPSAYAVMASTRSQLWRIDSSAYVYSTSRMDQICGGLLIGAPWKAQLKAAIPSDLAQHLKNTATQAASCPLPRDKTPAERVRDAVRNKIETALRTRSNAPNYAFTTPLFIKYPSLLPPVWVDWDPATTTVERDARWG
ncbi:hypothetical protein PFICI_08499 [Pestalotiopsis fici W106-1]|uniref:Uncharacterized protein n=1 Tax=Pestalotiopsis fici (strain W106-1 / CGMCC3.15140) TaxID=1229662 RepID=W3X0I2_PESFW|nr:uncharacterized protein PFICI_08499 [Pestalotiopsis fici W106-1]ETS78646.1 hypothetical protein PFICI_08499 [Pestalotiopsis fici W106-1]